jgi:hypothetical protein
MLNTFKKSQDLYKNRPWLTFLVLLTLGTMVLAVCSLLLGCGSDSTPGGAVEGKNAKTSANPNAIKRQAAGGLLLDKGRTDPVKMGKIKQPPEAKSIEVFPGITQAEIDAKAAAGRKKLSAPGYEIFPGITQEQIDAKVAAVDWEKLKSPGYEIFPGITNGELKARIAADLKKHDPKQMKVFPGITQAQIDAKIASQRVKPEKQEMFPAPVRK